jgi:polygalacturonase
MSGGVRNVFLEDCQMESVSSALYFKSNLDRGGLVERVWARRIRAQTARDGLVRFQTNYRMEDARGGGFPPAFRDFVLEDLRCQEARSFGVIIEGLAGHPIRDVTIHRATIEKAAIPYRLVRAENIRFDGVTINGAIMPSSPLPVAEGEEGGMGSK